MSLLDALNDAAVGQKAQELRPPDAPASWQPGVFELAWAIRQLHHEIPPASFTGDDLDPLVIDLPAPRAVDPAIVLGPTEPAG